MTKVDKKCVQNIKPDVKNIVLSMPGNKIGGFCNEHTMAGLEKCCPKLRLTQIIRINQFL